MTDGLENSVWISKVTVLLRQGYGVEDIAIMLGCGLGTFAVR